MAVRAPGIDAREINRVAGPLGAADIDAVRAFYGDVPHIISGGEGIADALRAAGYTNGYAWMHFARAPDAGVHALTDLRIEQVGPQGGMHFARPVRIGFGLPEVVEGALRQLPGRPGWTCLVAYDGDDAVAAGALFAAGDEGHVSFGATVPEARGRGAQSALLAERIAIAGRLGLRTLTTETGVREDGPPTRNDRSYRNILRAGFTETGAVPNWESITRRDAA